MTRNDKQSEGDWRLHNPDLNIPSAAEVSNLYAAITERGRPKPLLARLKDAVHRMSGPDQNLAAPPERERNR